MRLFLVIEIYDIYYKLICGKSLFLFLVEKFCYVVFKIIVRIR